jgi:hypothetical protein
MSCDHLHANEVDRMQLDKLDCHGGANRRRVKRDLNRFIAYEDGAGENQSLRLRLPDVFARLDVLRDHILNGAVVPSMASGNEECCRYAPGV